MTDSLSSSMMESRPPMSTLCQYQVHRSSFEYHDEIHASVIDLPSNVTGISSGATTSMAMVCSYVLRFNSCIRGRLLLESYSSSLS